MAEPLTKECDDKMKELEAQLHEMTLCMDQFEKDIDQNKQYYKDANNKLQADLKKYKIIEMDLACEINETENALHQLQRKKTIARENLARVYDLIDLNNAAKKDSQVLEHEKRNAYIINMNDMQYHMDTCKAKDLIGTQENKKSGKRETPGGDTINQWLNEPPRNAILRTDELKQQVNDNYRPRPTERSVPPVKFYSIAALSTFANEITGK